MDSKNSTSAPERYVDGWQDPRLMSQEELKSRWMRAMLDNARSKL